MHHIFTAQAREIVIALDPGHDLSICGGLLDTDDPGLSEEEVDRRVDENEARADSFFDDLCRQLRIIAERDHLTVSVGDESEATHTPLDTPFPNAPTLEEVVWQEAQDAATFTRCYEPETVRP